MQSCARAAFELAREMDQIGVVVDADGLWLVQVSPEPGARNGSRWQLAYSQNDPEVVKGWKGVPRIILTPNVMEFKRLCDTMVSHTLRLSTV